jgi:septum formation protein
LAYHFSIIPPNIDEKKRRDEQPEEFVLRISYERQIRLRSSSLNWVIAADTVVVLRGKVLGKPQTERDAYNMLKALAGKWHKVLTGIVCLILHGR